MKRAVIPCLALALSLSLVGCGCARTSEAEVEAPTDEPTTVLASAEASVPERVDVTIIDNEVLTVVVHEGSDNDPSDYRYDYDVSITNHTEEEIDLDLVEGSLTINGTPVTSSWPFVCPPLSPGETASGPCFSIEYFEGYASPSKFRGATIAGDLSATTGWWDWDGEYYSEELGVYHFEFAV